MENQNSGSATGNPRNKVALKPGHSLMDWIRLGNSGVDLAGTKGAILDVSPAQLAEHNTLTDCWLCIRGRVYNVSKYLDFHPGGVDELMKGAGKDATNLFNQVHPWVNFESLLQKCLVGRLITPTTEDDIFTSPQPGKSKSKAAQDVHSIAGALTSIITLGNSIVPGVDKTSYAKTDWYQQKDYVAFVLYHKQGNPEVLVDCRREKEVWIRVGSCGWVGWGIESTVSWPPNLIVTDTKVEVKLAKSSSGLWHSVVNLEGSGVKDCDKLPAKVLNTLKVLHNVFLICLEVTEKVYLHIPVGYHIQVSATIKGACVERNYTPVQGLIGSDIEQGLWLMVKSYPGGMMSPWLTTRKINDTLTISPPLGCFPLPTRLKPENNLLLFAAGSGVTPMIKLINWALKERPQVLVKLIFFNKTERDIIWWREFLQLSSRNRCFSCEHVLSDGSPNWKGLRGWVTLQLVQSFLPDFSSQRKNDFYVCVCGPISFTQLTERYLTDLGYSSDNCFCFRG